MKLSIFSKCNGNSDINSNKIQSSRTHIHSTFTKCSYSVVWADSWLALQSLTTMGLKAGRSYRQHITEACICLLKEVSQTCKFQFSWQATKCMQCSSGKYPSTDLWSHASSYNHAGLSENEQEEMLEASVSMLT